MVLNQRCRKNRNGVPEREEIQRYHHHMPSHSHTPKIAAPRSCQQLLTQPQFPKSLPNFPHKIDSVFVTINPREICKICWYGTVSL
ncbi:hypothetical protein L6452_02500 [Arctium lappa]|uniref:Uncharacterized protein n=1 Tax=Arctium lappa TaxID=4217 RepID=A0ACB9FJ16_ARCLA|nr:hypothetical protein L6452_02500 [Arctium lappa]